MTNEVFDADDGLSSNFPGGAKKIFPAHIFLTLVHMLLFTTTNDDSRAGGAQAADEGQTDEAVRKWEEGG